MSNGTTSVHPIRRSRYPLGGFLLVSLLPAGLAYAWLVSKAQWFWNHQSDLQFGWVVLLLCGYLFWEAWETRPSAAFRWTPWWLALVASALVLLFTVQVFQAACGSNAASVAGLALGALGMVLGNIGYVFGWRGVRHFAFAFLFLLIALPMPTVIHNIVVGGLQSKVTAITVEVLNLVGIPAQRVGSVIRLSNCTVGVDEACSGIRSLQSTLMATLFIGHLVLGRMSLKGFLVLSGLFLAIIGNLVRSLFLSYEASSRGIQALEAVHDTAGWSILLFTAAGVAALAYCLSRVERSSAAAAAVQRRS